MAPTWIAEERVTFVHPDGRREAGRIAVGLPELDDDGVARCPVVAEGCYPRLHPMAGDGTLQALLLGVRLLGTLLHVFKERGGRVLAADEDEELPLDAFFGPLLRMPEVPAAEDEGER